MASGVGGGGGLEGVPSGSGAKYSSCGSCVRHEQGIARPGRQAVVAQLKGQAGSGKIGVHVVGNTTSGRPT